MEAWARLILIGAAFILLGILTFVKGKKKQLRCTVPVIATIVRVNCDKNPSGDELCETKRYEYTPVYGYQVNGKEYTWEGTHSLSKNEYSAGDRAQLWYNPDNPMEATTVRATRGSGGFALVLIVLGILSFAAAFTQLK